jgi:GntR family transcriptional repressor for pyruvate dehydrogenase complex
MKNINKEAIKLNTVSRVNISTQIFEQIKEKIISGNWPPGAKIPSEKELTGMLGASRISIREALKKLSVLNLLEIRHGDGAYVRKINSETHLSSLVPYLAMSRQGILQILEFRKMVEVGTVELAIKNVTQEDITELERLVTRMKELKENPEEYAVEDFNFHFQIVKMSRNTIAINVYSLIRDALLLSLKNIVTHRGQKNSLRFHPLLLRAIKNKKPDLARRLMEEHLQKVIERIHNDKSIIKV